MKYFFGSAQSRATHIVFATITFMVAFVIAGCVAHGGEKPVSEAPIIDRNIFFSNPEISDAGMSPNGKYLSFLKPYRGVMNLWVKDVDKPFDTARPLTANSEALHSYLWAHDNKHIVFLKDTNGDENYAMYSVDITATPKASTETPPVKRFTPAKGVLTLITHNSRRTPGRLWIQMNNRDPRWFDLYVIDLASGNMNMVHKNTANITNYFFDHSDTLRLVEDSNTQTGETRILSVKTIKNGDITTFSFTPIYHYDISDTVSVLQWNNDNSLVYINTAKEANFFTLYLMNPNDGSVQKVENDPKGQADLESVLFNKGTVLATVYNYDKPRYSWKDPRWKKAYATMQKKFKNRHVTIDGFTDDFGAALLTVGGPTFANVVYYYSLQSDTLSRQFTSRPKLAEVERYLSPIKFITYPGSDGLKIPAYLTLPYGKKPRSLPLVVFPHGGPKGKRDNWIYDARVQILANRGYAVLQPNFRGSSGYGKTFLNAGDGEWGKLMQDDITWGVQYLIKKGIVDKNKIAILGGSYAGFATLTGITTTPDLYAAAVDIVGPANLLTFVDSFPPYWEASKKWFLKSMGADPSTPEGQSYLKKISPIFKVDAITAPVLVVQGAQDPRVNRNESDQMVAALAARGHTVQYLLAEDEGHGFHKPINNMAMWLAIERFLADHVSGRVQKTISPDVAAKLAELTQDVSKVRPAPRK